MLSGCKRDPENRIWYAPWKMTLKNDDTYIGTLSFKGPAQDNVVEIGYGILPDQEGKGYTTEAVQTMTQWAFGDADVVFVEAETEPENRASRRILEKCGFVSNLQIPTLIFHAKDDKLASYNDTERALSRFPDCTFVSFENGGHLMEGHGEEIKKAVCDFVMKHD